MPRRGAHAESSSQKPPKLGRPSFQPSTEPPSRFSVAKALHFGEPEPRESATAHWRSQPCGCTAPQRSGCRPKGTRGPLTRRLS